MSLPDRFIARYGRLPTERDPDYLEMLQMSKYVISDVPNSPPGKCANCGASKNDGRKYVDFGLQVDWYGTVHFCSHCLTDIGQAAGIFTELEKKLSIMLEEAQQFNTLKNQGVELHESVVKTFKGFEEYYDRLYSLESSSSPDVSASSDVVETESVEPGTNATKSRTSQSSNVPRSQNIRSLTDLLNDNGN